MPLDQVYVSAPFAVKVTEPPLHVAAVGVEILTMGKVFTTTEEIAVFEEGQPKALAPIIE
jgi:hypothetical protein